MRKYAYFEFISPWGKLLLLIGLVIIFSILTAFGGLMIGKYWLNTDIMSLANLISNPSTDEAINFGKFYQFLNQLGVFIFPVLLYTYLVSNSSFKYLKVNNKPQLFSILISITIVFSILPFLNYIAVLNMNMKLPESMSAIENWMMQKEEQATLLLGAFLKTSTISGLIINLIIIGIIPAIGEELLFRGVLLRLFKEIFKNAHIAVFISAILFSMVHMQFYGFFPRLLLGIVLGYLFVYTKSLWAPIAYHLVNNSASVIIYYFNQKEIMETSAENFGSTDNFVLILGSLIVSVYFIFLIKKKTELTHIQ
ncbi:MAG: hypothetical protein C0598_05915 [Marinilabiliales bacterium]|nr:MAG: hypothetical protein C0598_05915 [Marinilabiliales bacterium]